MSDKTIALEAIRELSEEATLEEIIEAIAILAAVRRGEQAADAGRVIPHEQVEKRVRGHRPQIT